MLSQACSDDFLETRSSTDISSPVVYETTGTARGMIYGVYKFMRSWTDLSNGRMDCSGLHTNLLVFDIMGSDITMPPVTWYWYDYDYWHTESETVFKTEYFWRFYYRIINNCNDVLFYVGDAEGPEPEKEAIRAEARALRAFAFWHLIQLYQQTYVIAREMPGVPLPKLPSTPSSRNMPRSSVEDVYELITTDLEFAVTKLADTREGKYYINREVAAGILARVYLTMGKWGEAAQMAAQARANYTLMNAAQWQAGFNDSTNPEWIWAVHQTTDQNVGWGSSFSVLDFAGGDQHNFRIASSLADKYSATDIRGGDMFQTVGTLIGNKKFREPSMLNTGHMVLMRSSEMLLIEAECAARSNDPATAQDLLYELQSKRDAAAVKSTLQGDPLVELILLERRKELWAEGFGLHDLIRNQKPLVRDGDHTSVHNIPARSWQFIFQIPRNEIDINEGINEEDQNPLSGVYNP